MDEVSAFVADQLGVCIYVNETHITDQGWLKATLQVGGVIRNQLNSVKKKEKKIAFGEAW